MTRLLKWITERGLEFLEKEDPPGEGRLAGREVSAGRLSHVTVLALRLSQRDQIPVQVTAWYRKGEPMFANCLALVRRHLWRTRYCVNSAAEADFVQFPCEALDLLISGFLLAA